MSCVGERGVWPQTALLPHALESRPAGKPQPHTVGSFLRPRPSSIRSPVPRPVPQHGTLLREAPRSARNRSVQKMHAATHLELLNEAVFAVACPDCEGSGRFD